ncbi:cysteine-rich venom protein-like [Rhinatrema bivittatum]|uniref:cysteine-rich venom protein-like n=1 Tax=Rhinatrema bivittatum TaxID=194408 RepID=UPI00112E3A2F|nr:cysteine-rich venom protein-like [Rhinatrema bivittatum]
MLVISAKGWLQGLVLGWMVLAVAASVQLGLLDTNLATVQNEIVNRHNALRRSVNPTASNMLRMEWNNQAASNAEKWIKKCIVSNSPREERKTDNFFCGENLFFTTYPAPWSDVMERWFNESSNFIYGTGAKEEGLQIEGYTQAVWYNSHQIGCAAFRCLNNTYQYFYACHYCPPGNYINSMKEPYKRGQPCGDCPHHCDNKLCTNPCPYQDFCTRNRALCIYKSFRDNCLATCNCLTEII